MTIDDIRAQYPNPIRMVDAANYVEAKRYCVGGSICRAYEVDGCINGFPSDGQLARVLRLANPQLDTRRARHYAETIVKRNDMGLFEDAWYYANRALTYQPKEN